MEHCIQVERELDQPENLFLSGGKAGPFSPASGQCLQTLYGHTDRLRSLLIKDYKLISTESSGVLLVYDVKMFTLISKFYSDAGYTSQRVFEHNRNISGDASGQLHILEMIGI